MDTHTALFLHGGPGFSAHAERALYGSDLPIFWWDQPRSVVLFARPFDALVEAAEEQLELIRREGQRKVDVIGYSFGANLALQLAMRRPEAVGHVLLLAPVYDVGKAFVRLAQRVLLVVPRNPELQSALAHFRSSGEVSDFLTLAETTLCPQALDLFWGGNQDDRKSWYNEMLAAYPIIDMNAFGVILRDFWGKHVPVAPVAANCPVTLVAGRSDVLVDPDTVVEEWVGFFPQLTARFIDSGHMIPYEHAPGVWLPRN